LTVTGHSPRLDVEILAAARVLWDFHRLAMEPRPSDVLIVLGSYDLRVADEAARLFACGQAPVALVTGGYGNWTRERFTRPEAEIFAERLAASGVPPAAILIEPRASNIGENVRFTRDLLADRAIVRALFVTKPQTQRRVYLTARAQWPDLDVLVTAPPTPFVDQPTADHDMAALINEMVGDIERIRTYALRGWQAHEAIPAATAAATQVLIELGFTAHLPQ
jgi:uncharacterized SAM-binding protein YcdF (DUF218 family)